jgi:hypothetical protein
VSTFRNAEEKRQPRVIHIIPDVPGKLGQIHGLEVAFVGSEQDVFQQILPAGNFAAVAVLCCGGGARYRIPA